MASSLVLVLWTEMRIYLAPGFLLSPQAKCDAEDELPSLFSTCQMTPRIWYLPCWGRRYRQHPRNLYVFLTREMELLWDHFEVGKMALGQGNPPFHHDSVPLKITPSSHGCCLPIEPHQEIHSWACHIPSSLALSN